MSFDLGADEGVGITAIDGDEYDKVILGRCVGVGLGRRSPDDPHICFTLLSKSESDWSAAKANTWSSFWLPDLLDVMRAAYEWMEQTCIPDIPVNAGKSCPADRSCGWRFKAVD